MVGHRLWVLWVCLALSPGLGAGTLELFIDDQHGLAEATLSRLRARHEVVIHDLSLLAWAHAELNRRLKLPADEPRAAARRLQKALGGALKEALARGWRARHQAERYGIETLPAAVIGAHQINGAREIEKFLNEQ